MREVFYSCLKLFSYAEAFYSCLKLFSHAGSFLFMLEIFSHAGSFLVMRNHHEKLVVTCHHVIKKKATGKLFCHAGGPEKQ